MFFSLLHFLNSKIRNEGRNRKIGVGEAGALEPVEVEGLCREVSIFGGKMDFPIDTGKY